MNSYELPFGLNHMLAFNCFNFCFGIITIEDFTMISGLAGLLMNLIFFVVKMYLVLAGKKMPEESLEPPVLTDLLKKEKPEKEQQ
ncbi:MAG: hypothetical protein U5L45_15840 [Saprospiraceae bacterium]|nr:hypothetical protein [Saprospiraceae bacterium]